MIVKNGHWSPFYRKSLKFVAPKFFEIEKSPKCAQGHTTTQRSHAQKHSIHRKARFCASNQRSFSMRRLVAKYRFVKSDLWSLCSTNGMARWSLTMAQTIGTTWLCVLSSKLVCVHQQFAINFRHSDVALCTMWHPHEKSERSLPWNQVAYCTQWLPFTSEFPVLRFAQSGLQMRNRKANHL